MTKKTFNKRKVVALILLATLVLMPVSGIIIHVTHGAAISHTWLHIHVLFGILFVVAAIYHVVCNWRTLKYYFTDKKHG